MMATSAEKRIKDAFLFFSKFTISFAYDQLALHGSHRNSSQLAVEDLPSLQRFILQLGGLGQR
jgi:hypothetical protein